MPLKITQDCVNCAACADVCPNEGISPGRSAYVIDPAACTECVGYYAVQQCVAICPSDCVVPDPRAAMTEAALFQRAVELHAGSPRQPVLSAETSHFRTRSPLATAVPDAPDVPHVHSTPSRRWLPLVAVALVLAVWVVSAYHGREYLSASLDAANLERKIGWPIALSIFGVSTTFIWLGLVVGTLVIAWRRWSVLQPQRAERAGSTSSDR